MKIPRFCRFITTIVLLPLFMTSGITALAQDVSTDSGGSDAAQANNPLADFRAFNLQNYYIPELSGPIDATANNFVLRYAQPFGKWLMRASLPFARVPTGVSSTESGVGDLDVFFAYLFDTGNPARSFGVGPQLVSATSRCTTATLPPASRPR